ncbi:beta strand repeat-containing protein [Pseudogulbenkiania sp. NH8B]|uniref:beta strand repeat-containing protein n=1 Tax=Pseudogulbenkiania sp. (strain NH8B) TaxID=748280 RepID=UPI001E2AF4CC|nr:VCBS domain-containing protein [Pseudogulbenkiania sp. NH8B]
MANDLGGAAKTLYSVDDGTNSAGITSSTDLLTKDTAYSTDVSAHGARIWITTDGRVGYDASTLSADFKATLNALGAGEYQTDTFTYAIRLGNGTLSWATATVQFAGVNDAATFSGDDTKGLTETDAAQTTGGTLVAHDVDSAETFQAQSNVAGSSGYGHFTIGSDGTWSYTMDSAHNEFKDGVNYSDTLVVKSADGTEHTLTVNIAGTNDAATFSGDDSKGLTETDAAQSTGGTLVAHDVDSAETFQAQTNVAGSNGYGHFTIGSDGTWSYTMDSAHNEFKDGENYSDTLVVQSADGTEHTLTVNITGTNDAATFTGDDSKGLTETDAAQTTGGTLVAHDVDSAETFQAQTNVAGSNGYGHFTIGSDGTWSYTMDSAHNEFAAGTTYSDTLVVQSADGTEHTLTVNILGTNDAATFTGDDSKGLTETDAAQTTGGTLVAHDVDSAETFQAQSNVAGSNGYGHFTIGSDGTWSYTMDSAHNEFKDGVNYSDTLVVKSADGTEHTLTVNITGTNDAATFSGDDSKGLTETDAAQSTGGTLVAHDVDSAETFQAQTNVAGSQGYGHFTIGSDGAWSYTMDSAHNEFKDGVNYTDTLVVKSADGTEHTLTVNITGTNDAATFSGDDTKGLTETDAAQTTGGTLVAHDVDSAETFQAQTNVAGSQGYGHFTIGSDGTWSYSMDSAHDEFAGGTTNTDTLVVQSADGTEHTLTVNITGTNDAATITASASEDTSVTEVGSGVAGDSSAGGQLTVHDVDNGEAHFQTPVSLTGTYGDFSFNASTGVWSYALDDTRPATDALATGSVVHDTLTVKSFDGSASYTIDVAVNGSNDSVNHAPTDIVLSMAEPGGNALPGAGAVLGTLSTIDVDSGDTFTYSLISSSTVSGSAASFSISGNSLSTGTGLASNSVYQLDIQTTDSASATYHEVFNIITGTNAQGQVTGDDGSLPSGGGANSILIGDDVLYGSGGNDVMFGGSGNDTLFGQNGNDVLYGGAGNDTLSGGNQADRFVFLASDNGGTDTITNFTATGANADTLDISDLLINYNPATPSAFVHFTESGGNTIVSVDRDGSGGSYGFQDVAILNGVTGLNMNDMLTSGKLDVVP